MLKTQEHCCQATGKYGHGAQLINEVDDLANYVIYTESVKVQRERKPTRRNGNMFLRCDGNYQERTQYDSNNT